MELLKGPVFKNSFLRRKYTCIKKQTFNKPWFLSSNNQHHVNGLIYVLTGPLAVSIVTNIYTADPDVLLAE